MELRAAACEHAAMSQGTFQKYRWRLIGAGFLAIVVIGLGVGEALGWRFLGAPMQRWIGQAIDRRVSFSADPATRRGLGSAPFLGGVGGIASRRYTARGLSATGGAPVSRENLAFR